MRHLVIVAIATLLSAACTLVAPQPSATLTESGGPSPGAVMRVTMESPGLRTYLWREYSAMIKWDRAFANQDQSGVVQIIGRGQWIEVADGTSVRVVDVEERAVYLELLDGPNAGQRGWSSAIPQRTHRISLRLDQASKDQIGAGISRVLTPSDGSRPVARREEVGHVGSYI